MHLADGARDDPSPNPLFDAAIAADEFRASGRQHPVQNRHADGGLSLLGSETACSQLASSCPVARLLEVAGALDRAGRRCRPPGRCKRTESVTR